MTFSNLPGRFHLKGSLQVGSNNGEAQELTICASGIMNTNHEIWEVKTVKSALHSSWIVRILNFEIWLIHLTNLRLKIFFKIFLHFPFQNQSASLTDKAAGGTRARSYCSKLLQETTEEEAATCL